MKRTRRRRVAKISGQDIEWFREKLVTMQHQRQSLIEDLALLDTQIEAVQNAVTALEKTPNYALVPSRYMRPEFQEKPLSSVVLDLINSQECVSADQLTAAIYDTQTSQEFANCKAVIVTAVSRLAAQNRVVRPAAGIYARKA